MSELYLVEAQTIEDLSLSSASSLIRDGVLRVAQKGKLKDVARLKKDPDGWIKDLIATLAALPADKAKKALPPNAGLLPLPIAIKQLLLHLAHPTAHPRPAATRVVLRVRSIHPDAGMPKNTNPAQKLDTFILRLIGDASPNNEVRARYPRLLESKLRVRSEDLWDFTMTKAKKVAPLSPMPGDFFESEIEVITDAAVVVHLGALKDKRWSSTAFEG
jgi:hypothetical protein